MPSDATTKARITRLDPKTHLATIKSFVAAKAEKRAADAASRTADKIVKAGQGTLMAAMGEASVATCGEFTLTVKAGENSPASVTISDGRTILLSQITSILVGNEMIRREDVMKIWGGRDGSVSLDATGPAA